MWDSFFDYLKEYSFLTTWATFVLVVLAFFKINRKVKAPDTVEVWTNENNTKIEMKRKIHIFNGDDFTHEIDTIQLKWYKWLFFPKYEILSYIVDLSIKPKTTTEYYIQEYDWNGWVSEQEEKLNRLSFIILNRPSFCFRTPFGKNWKFHSTLKIYKDYTLAKQLKYLSKNIQSNEQQNKSDTN